MRAGGWSLATGVMVSGLGLWGAGLSSGPSAQEWLAQSAWVAIWLLTVESCYGAILAATTDNASRSSRTLGALRRGRDWVVLCLVALLLMPLSVVAEVSAQWAANHLLYEPGHADAVFLGWLRGLIDSSPYVTALDVTELPLTWFARVVLGFQDEVHSFAAVVCAALVGNALWAILAMHIGTGVLREASPLVARAFRLAALQAATAPLFTFAYFCLRGGEGVNAWSGLFSVLVGTLEAGGQVPSWVRVVGVAIFFLLPAAMVAWRLRADHSALVAEKGPSPSHRSISVSPCVVSQRSSWTILAAVVGVLIPLLTYWATHLSAGPFSWMGQTVWLGLWLVFLAVCYEGTLRIVPRPGVRAAGRPSDTGSYLAKDIGQQVLLVWPLATAALVIQVGVQVVALHMLDDRPVEAQFFGWLLGQAGATGRGAALPPEAIAACFLGSLGWAVVLAVLATFAWHGRWTLMGKALRLGALQAATAPMGIAAYMVLSIVTRDRAAAGVGRFDPYHGWTYLVRAAQDASLVGEDVPFWLRLLAVILLISTPIIIARACFSVEREVRVVRAGRGYRSLVRLVRVRTRGGGNVRAQSQCGAARSRLSGVVREAAASVAVRLAGHRAGGGYRAV